MAHICIVAQDSQVDLFHHGERLDLSLAEALMVLCEFDEEVHFALPLDEPQRNTLPLSSMNVIREACLTRKEG